MHANHEHPHTHNELINHIQQNQHNNDKSTWNAIQG